MGLASIPNELLQEILPYLPKRDMLNVVLTAKGISLIVRPHLVTSLSCKTPEQLRQMHQYLLTDSAPSMSDIQASAFWEADLVEAHDASQPSVVSLLGDILVEAHGLRTLTLEEFEPCLIREPRIKDALQSLTELRKLHLDTLDDYGVSILQACQGKIQFLRLCYHDRPIHNLDDDRAEPRTLSTLIQTLQYPAFQELKVLILSSFMPSDTLGRDFSDTRLHSIICLQVDDCSPAVLDMVRLCPNLEKFRYSISYDFADKPAPRPWPALRCLSLKDHRDVTWALGNARAVERLQIETEMLSPETDWEQERANLYALLRSMSAGPFELSLRISVSPGSHLDLWGEIANASPRLRVLKLIWDPSGLQESPYEEWLDALPGLLSPLKISVMWLHVPRTVFPLGLRWVNPLDVDAVAAQRARVVQAREREHGRTEAMSYLPRRLAEAIPSLRSLAVVDDGANLEILALPPNGDLSGERFDKYGRFVRRAEHDAVGAVARGGQRNSCRGEEEQVPDCWQIVDDVYGKSLRKITLQEWECAREQSIDAARKGL